MEIVGVLGHGQHFGQDGHSRPLRSKLLHQIPEVDCGSFTNGIHWGRQSSQSAGRGGGWGGRGREGKRERGEREREGRTGIRGEEGEREGKRKLTIIDEPLHAERI